MITTFDGGRGSLQLEAVQIPDVTSVSGHVVLIHGFGRDVNSDWHTEGSYWPLQLGRRLPSHAVWVVSYRRQDWTGRDSLPLLARELERALRARRMATDSPYCFVARDLGALIALRMTIQAGSSMRARGFAFVHAPLSNGDVSRWFRSLRGRSSSVEEVVRVEWSETSIRADLALYRQDPRIAATRALWVADAEAMDESANEHLFRNDDNGVDLSKSCAQRLEAFVLDCFEHPREVEIRVPHFEQRFAIGPNDPGEDLALDRDIEYIARELHRLLRARRIDCFLARALSPGTEWELPLFDALERCGTFVPFITKSTRGRRWQMREIRMCLERARNGRGPRIYPCVLNEEVASLETSELGRFQYRPYSLPVHSDLAGEVEKDLVEQSAVGPVFLSIPHWSPSGAASSPSAPAQRFVEDHAGELGIPCRRRVLGVQTVCTTHVDRADGLLQIAAHPVECGPTSTLAAARAFLKRSNARLAALHAGLRFVLPTARELEHAYAARVDGFQRCAEMQSEFVRRGQIVDRWWRTQDCEPRTEMLVAPHEPVASLVLRPVLEKE